MKIAGVCPVVILLLTILAGCSVVDGNSDKSTLVGQWEWIRSSGGFAGQTTTPDSTGEPGRQLNLNSDHTFSFFRADTLVESGTYSLKEVEGNVFISYDNFFFDQRVKIFGEGDTLILAEECYDCYVHTYIRK